MFLPAGISANFTAVFASANPAFVAMSVYDDSGPTPQLLLSPVAMNLVKGNVYSQKFTPQTGKLYVVFMGVYTDATFVTLDPSFATAEQAFSVSAQYFNPAVASIVGTVDCN